MRSAIEFCEKKGWKTIAALKHATYWYAKTHPGLLEEGDFEILEIMINDGKLELITQKDEDIYWIDYALKNSAYIITHDTFKDKKDEKRERSLYPDRPWDEIDRRTLSYSFILGDFICPDLPKKADFIPEDSFGKLLEENVQLKKELDEERAKNRILTAQMKSKQKIQTNYDSQIVAVFERLLQNGCEIPTLQINYELAKEICGYKGNPALGNWPDGWSGLLKEELGFSRKKKFTSFLEDISQIVTNQINRRIEFNSNRTRIKFAP